LAPDRGGWAAHAEVEHHALGRVQCLRPEAGSPVPRAAQPRDLGEEPGEGGCESNVETCTNPSGRLVKVKTKFACDDSKGDDTFDQVTYFGYDDAGRTVKETIQDDGGRDITQSYGWDKNGKQTSVTPGSGIVATWTHGSAGSNSDADRIVSLTRTVGSPNTTLICNQIQRSERRGTPTGTRKTARR
jgi:YD repeat-containing protein